MNVLPQNGYTCLEISNGKSEKYIKIVDEQCCILLIDHTIQGSKQLENSTSIKNTAYTFTGFLNINFGGQLTKQQRKEVVDEKYSKSSPIKNVQNAWFISSSSMFLQILSRKLRPKTNREMEHTNDVTCILSARIILIR